MKLYRTKKGIIIEVEDNYYLEENVSWDSFFNDDNLIHKIKDIQITRKPVPDGSSILESEIMAPIQSQEIWASGVTYYNSKLGRQEESKNSGGGQFYAHVYEAVRPLP